MKNKSHIGREKGKPFVARDGALIFELFINTGIKITNMSIASGYLKPRQKALPHYHKTSEEIYYVISGSGKVRVGKTIEKIKEGEAVYIPIRAAHALENTRDSKMKILAVCSPPYQDSDMFFIE